VDKYEFIRNAYFQQRNNLVYDGNPPPQDDDLEKQLDELESSSSYSSGADKIADQSK
jgi:phospholipid-binding lipoprotein MlaA